VVDHQNSVDPAAAPGEPVAVPAKGGFLGTTTGKLVIGGVALLLVLGAIGAAVAYFFMSGAVDGSVQVTTPPQSTSSASGSITSTETPVNPAERSLASTFTFRNVFAPSVKATFETTATTASSATSGTVPNVPRNTLLLQDIVSQDGKPVAVFVWNGETYSVNEGERVGDSPWKVVQINSDSVLMLYGDSQVTLSVGQGVSK